MKRLMKSSSVWRRMTLLAAIVMYCSATASAQSWSQATACPGWNNPLNFTQGQSGSVTGGNYQGWQGQTGVKEAQVPNVQTGNTSITWNTTIAANNMASTQMSIGTGSYPDCAKFPGWSSTNTETQNNAVHAHCFAILDTNTQVQGYAKNRDPNTGTNASNQLPFVPVQYNIPDSTSSVQTNLYRCVRVGHACGRESGTPNASAVYYYMNVTPNNAMLYLYYACVFESPSHSASENPIFIIRVMKKNAAGQWVQASPTNTYPSGTNQCDSLTYMVTSTLATNGGTVVPGQNGWHQHSSSIGYRNSSQNVLWKDWTKVSLNLSSLMYSNVRIEVMVSACSMTQHYSYAYICGECRPMQISSSGCPAGFSHDVTTLTAPRGLNNYVWYRSKYGFAPNPGSAFLPGGVAEYYEFEQLTPEVGTEADSAFKYRVQASDFRVEYRRNSAGIPNIPASADSMGNQQTFRCEMTSAIDPAKPFKSNLYVNVQNTKPTMDIKTQTICGGDVQLRNTSYVPGDQSMVVLDSTVWSFYNNPACLGLADTVIRGETAAIHFDGGSVRGVKVRSNINEELIFPESSRPAHNACYSEEKYPIQPLPNPVGGFTATPKVLCDDDPTTLRDTTAGSTYRVWRFRGAAEDSPMTLTDSVVGVGENNRVYSRSFTHSHEPIEMLVRNGLFYLNPDNQSDTIWCENTISDAVSVFLHPELNVVGDTIVCQGDRTDATVSTVGVDSCRFQWSTSYGTISGGIPEGSHLSEIPYADTATYYVRVTSPQNCVAWDSIHAYVVRPILSMIPPDGKVCPGDEVTLIGSNAHHYSWTASPTDPSLGLQDTAERIVVTPQQSTTYTLVGHGSNNCNATPLTANVTVYPYPVSTVELDPGIVDSENPTLILRDVSPYSVGSMWTFSGGEMVEGREVTHTFSEATGVDSVYVTLTNVNEIGCQSVYPFGIPVNLYTAWFPNIFTPGSEDANARFRLFTINAYEHFHVYIYNRFGQLVFESSDPSFEWDGTMSDGSKCPQGTYTYVCRFRKPGAYSLVNIQGSITLVR